MRSKYILVFIVLLSLSLITRCSCSKDEDVRIILSESTANIPAIGGEYTIQVSGVTGWSVRSDAHWISTDRENFSSLIIKAGANSGGERQGLVTLVAGVLEATVYVTQGVLNSRQRDSLALVAFYNATNGFGWRVKWNLLQPMNQWAGVKINNGRVISLDLANNHLDGMLPEEFYTLSALQFCDLHDNALSGSLRATVNGMEALKYLDLSENKFSGNIPPINVLIDLILLDCSKNNFSGSLPDITALLGAEYFSFSQNELNGELPEAWGFLKDLNTLDLSNNRFTGNIPSTWSALNRLQILYLYGNTLEGALPDFWEAITSLVSLALDGNNFSGNIPETLGDLPDLEELWLNDNRLTGSIPVSLYNHLYWDSWQLQVCPQQSGYGFDNCSAPADASLRINNASVSPALSKEKWRKKIADPS